MTAELGSSAWDANVAAKLAGMLPGSALSELAGVPVVLAVVDQTAEALELVWSAAVPPEQAEAWTRIPLAADVPLSEAVRRGEPVLSDALPQRLSRYPTIPRRLNGAAAGTLAVPVWARTGDGPAVIGAVGVGFRGSVPPYALQTVTVFAAQCAQAIKDTGVAHGTVRTVDERSDPLALGATAEVADAVAVARALAEEQARRTMLLQRLTAALAAAADTQQVAEAVLTMVLDTLGADAGAITQRDPSGRSRALASVGSPLSRSSWEEVAHGATPMSAEVLATGRPVVITNRSDRDARYPTLAGLPMPHQAWVAVPLLIHGERVGIAEFAWTEPRQFAADEVDLLVAVADYTANAIERTRLLDRERRARAHLTLLAEASAPLTTATTEADQLAGLANALVDAFCDCCTILVPDELGRLRREVIRIRGVQKQLVDRLTGAGVMLLGEHDPRAVAWRERHVARADVDDLSAYFGQPSADVATDTTTPGPGTLIAAPMVARDGMIGVITAWRAAGRDEFDTDDEQLLADLGHRAGTAIDNLRLLAERTYVAARLQDTLLPAQLPTIDGVELAAGYLVAEAAADVGGDLYDVFPISSDGGYALIVGDVTGRGAGAAGLTGITRAALRALAGQLPVPAALARLNTLLAEQTGDERFLTLAYLHLQPTADGAVLDTWLAGHPAPVLIHPDGSHTEVGVPGPALGILDEVEFTATRHHLYPGDTLLAYTDGLIEARGPRGQFGDADLPALLPTLAGHPATDVVARVEQALLDYRDGGADDTALLVSRLTPPAEPSEYLLLDEHLPASAAAVPQTRHQVRDVLATEVAPDLIFDILLAVSELLANAVQQLTRQPPRSPRLDPIHLRILRRGNRLRVEISNPGPRFRLPNPADVPPATDLAESGRGLQLVQAIATDLGVITSSGTTCVWFETPLRY
ncbi:SpoIIE family protein phosphatase [Planosporangium sp. 12N6]|uniref:SpoIIE family protein phosphatase n=1 Tax=Planosporangium spinosum TaxID=3402278 RepID=UPI003CEA883F